MVNGCRAVTELLVTVLALMTVTNQYVLLVQAYVPSVRYHDIPYQSDNTRYLKFLRRRLYRLTLEVFVYINLALEYECECFGPRD